jgi:hypothetical protein
MADKVAFIKGTGAKGTRKCLAVSGAVWVYFMFSRHVELKLREIREQQSRASHSEAAE